jgi:hypothetical protein
MRNLGVTSLTPLFRTCISKHFSFTNGSCTIQDLVAWIGSHHTLINMTSLETVVVVACDDMSMLDCSALFSLRLTSTLLRKFHIYFGHDNGCSDDVMSALSLYLSAVIIGHQASLKSASG